MRLKFVYIPIIVRRTVVIDYYFRLAYLNDTMGVDAFYMNINFALQKQDVGYGRSSALSLIHI